MSIDSAGIRYQLKKIDELAKKKDHEAAHMLADRLWQDVLYEIAHMHLMGVAGDLAREALRVLDIPFRRFA